MHLWRSTLFIRVVILVALLVGLRDASANPSRDPAAADALYQRGRAFLKAGDLEAAYRAFEESMRLDPATGTLLNMGDCAEQLGRYATAWQHFVEAKERLPPNDHRLAFARKRIEQLAPKVPRLVIQLHPSCARTSVFRDDVELGSASLGVPLPVDQGPHIVTLRAKNAVVARYQVTLPPGDTVRLETRSCDGKEQNVGSEPSSPGGSPGLSRSGAGAYVFIGAGALLLGVGAVTGLVTLQAIGDANDNCTPDGRCNQAGLDAAERGKIYGIVSPVAFGLGAVGLVTGGYLLFSGKKSSVSAGPFPGGMGATATVRWAR